MLERAGYILGIIIFIAALILGFGMYAKRQAIDFSLDLPFQDGLRLWSKTFMPSGTRVTYISRSLPVARFYYADCADLRGHARLRP